MSKLSIRGLMAALAVTGMVSFASARTDSDGRVRRRHIGELHRRE